MSDNNSKHHECPAERAMRKGLAGETGYQPQIAELRPLTGSDVLHTYFQLYMRPVGKRIRSDGSTALQYHNTAVN